MSDLEFGTTEQSAANRLIALALCEDLGGGPPFLPTADLTTSTLVGPEEGTVQITARQAGVLAGLPIIPQVIEQFDPSIRWTPQAADGETLAAGQSVGLLTGSVRSLLVMERTMLNFLTHLSGIATLTATFVRLLTGTKASLFDTRKTLPGWRALAKYAVRAGGGKNHRIGLYDQVLVKDNHLGYWQASHPATEQSATTPRSSTAESAAAGTISGGPAAAARLLRERLGAGIVIQIEVDTLEQLQELLTSPVDLILLDNMSLDQLRTAVALRDKTAPQIHLEASGGVRLETVRAIAETGVDRISVGALTHSAPTLDHGFDWPAAQTLQRPD